MAWKRSGVQFPSAPQEKSVFSGHFVGTEISGKSVARSPGTAYQKTYGEQACEPSQVSAAAVSDTTQAEKVG